MLLYNQRKEFIGIDEDDLKGLDFQNIAELQNESHDFADLFVKKPGFIHNFKNFSWIDFILHSESDESKAIIHAKGKNYSCTLHVSPFHFTSDESGYAVFIKNLRSLRGAEDAQATKDLQSAGGIRPTPVPAAAQPVPETRAAQAAVQTSHPELDISLDEIKTPKAELPNFEQSYSYELSEPEALDIPEAQEIDLGLSSGENEFGAPSGIDYNVPLTLDDDLMMDEVEESLPSFEMPSEETPAKIEKPMLGDYVSGGEEYLSELVKSGTYKFDPEIAANELGLPVDLIEEFIGDFIDQAHEFHDDLYASVNAGDFDNVQILSHKLKGVAANLRVEDAFDTLSVVNNSKDVDEILPNLNQFYKIIARLEGKELPQAAAPVSSPAPSEPAEPDYDFSIKQPEEGPLLVDEEVGLLSDDMYGDLLSTKENFSEESAKEPEAQAAPLFEEDDIYGDLLGTPESSNEASAERAEVPASPSYEDESLYDDLLGTPKSFDEPVMEETEAPAFPSYEDEDLYGNLLGTQESFDEPVMQEPEAPLSASYEDDVLYDELLGTAQENVAPAAEEVSVGKLNIDVQRTANELGISADIVNDFIQDFKEQIHIHRDDFENALSSQDLQEVNNLATILKGMSDNLRLNEISEVLKQLQKESNIDNAAEAFARLQAYADQL